jgi:hypothetical protein
MRFPIDNHNSEEWTPGVKKGLTRLDEQGGESLSAAHLSKLGVHEAKTKADYDRMG